MIESLLKVKIAILGKFSATWYWKRVESWSVAKLAGLIWLLLAQK